MKKLFSVIGIIVGVAILVFAIVVFSSSTNTSYSNSYSFGADFYTESQNATADAANNVRAVAGLLRTCFGLLLLSIGMIDICYFGVKLAPDKHQSDNSSIQQPADLVPDKQQLDDSSTQNPAEAES